jgi:predicted DNA-binding transcriptional regulator AlpA
MSPRTSHLPLNCPPIGLSRLQAAEYIGVSSTKFDQLVADGRLPPPRRIDGRKVWFRPDVDLAFAALPADTSDADPQENEWDDTL